MKFPLEDKNESITSPHTNRKYLNTINSWNHIILGRKVISTYFALLEEKGNSILPEGELIYLQFFKDDVKKVDHQKTKLDILKVRLDIHGQK